MLPTSENIQAMLESMAKETRVRKRVVRKHNKPPETVVDIVPTQMAVWAKECMHSGVPHPRLEAEMLRRFRKMWRLPATGRQHWFKDGHWVARPDRYIVTVGRPCTFRQKLVVEDWYVDTYLRVHPEGPTEAFLEYAGPQGLPGNRQKVVGMAEQLEESFQELAKCQEIQLAYDEAYDNASEAAWVHLQGIREGQQCLDLIAMYQWRERIGQYGWPTWRAGLQAIALKPVADTFAKQAEDILEALANRMSWDEERALHAACQAVMGVAE